MLNTGANKSIYAIVIGAVITVVQNFFPDLMDPSVWGSIQTALVGIAVWAIGNRS